MVDLDRNVLIFGGRDGVSVQFIPKEEASRAAHSMMYGESVPTREVQNGRRESNNGIRNLFGRR